MKTFIPTIASDLGFFPKGKEDLAVSPRQLYNSDPAFNDKTPIEEVFTKIPINGCLSLPLAVVEVHKVVCFQIYNCVS